MLPVRTLHIASFAGNTGDGAMHDGAYRTRAQDIGQHFTYERIEIRDFIHWGLRRFDETFLDLSKTADLVLFGGNSIFQMWRDNTASGTYFDFTPDFLLQLRCPVVFYGIGCDATRGVHPLAIKRMRSFLDHCSDPERFLYSLRNDGSREIVEQAVGVEYASRMPVIPDGGLFARPDTAAPKARNYVIVNLAGDMPDIRFGTDDLSGQTFARALAKRVEALLLARPDVDVMFAPHVYSDIKLIADCLGRLDDKLRRTRIEVAPYQVDEHAWSRVFALYRGASAVLSMRFHGSIVPIGLGVPTVGLSSHHKLAGLFAGLSLENQCVRLESGSPEPALDDVFALLDHALEDSAAASMRSSQLEACNNERINLSAFHHELSSFLDRALSRT